jgi:hypothetical protein
MANLIGLLSRPADLPIYLLVDWGSLNPGEDLGAMAMETA